jgi:hypothetical protein
VLASPGGWGPGQQLPAARPRQAGAGRSRAQRKPRAPHPGRACRHAQVDSRKESLPGWRMGTSNRFKYADIEAAAEMPGAGQYRAATAVGKQALSSKKSLPTVKFGTSTRDAAKKVMPPLRGCKGAGAGRGARRACPCCPCSPAGRARRRCSAVQQRPLAALRRSKPRRSASTQLRPPTPLAPNPAAAPAPPQTFISKEHEKQSFGEVSPGPATAGPKSSLGRQLLSDRSSAPGWGFGSSQVRAPGLCACLSGGHARVCGAGVWGVGVGPVGRRCCAAEGRCRRRQRRRPCKVRPPAVG